MTQTVNLNIDKFLGIRNDASGDTNIKVGELSQMQNFKIVEGYNAVKRNGYTGLLTKTTLKNLITNGNFASGTTGWTATSTASFTVTAGVASFTVSAKYGRIAQAKSLVAGDIYYMFANVKSGSALANMRVYDGVSNIINVYHSGSGAYERLSGRGASGKTGSGSVQITDVGESGWAAINVDDVCLINLSDCFGKGKEPTEEWCDANITYFDGAVSIAGYVPLGKAIQGQWYGKIGNTYYHLYACNGHVYQNNGDGTYTDLGTLTDTKTDFFFFGDAVYIINGYEYKKWTGTGVISDVSGHVPIIAVSTKPDGSSATILEGINLLHNQRRQRFNGDNASATFVLLEQNITSIDSVLVSGNLKTVTTHYTVDLAAGTITFTAGNIPAIGIDNVEIKWTNNSKTQYFSGTGSQIVFQLDETNITSVEAVTVSGSSCPAAILKAFTAVNYTGKLRISCSSHGYSNNQAIRFTGPGLPSNISPNTTYYVLYEGTAAFQVRTTSGGTALDYVDDGSGSVFIPGTYIANTTAGTVEIHTAPPSGTKNISVTYSSTSNNRKDVSKYTNHKLYGGKNDNRVFLFGSGNRMIYSGLADGVPSAEYFPALNYMDVGSEEFAINDLSAQYDRMMIHKEVGTWWTQYEYDSTLGVSFPVYPLNDTIGSSFKGSAQVIKNNPYVIHGKSVYEFVASNVRDERNAKYISERVQPLLSALATTNLLTFENDADKEYWVISDRNCYIYNYGLDVWYYYLFADSIRSICKGANGIVLGTSDGQLMLMNSTLTDNGTTITAFLETGWLDYNLPTRRKFLNFLWLIIKPNADTSATLYDATDRQALKLIKTVTYAGADSEPQTFRIKCKAKKFIFVKFKISNAEAEALTVLGISAPALIGGLSK